MHRAVQAYAPGSTFKVLSAFAIFDPHGDQALERGWTTYCDGILNRKQRSFRCDGVHHTTDLVKSLCHSCNVFYFRAGDRLGLDPISDWAARLGLGDRLAADVFGERGGQVPYEGYKQDRAERAEGSVSRWGEQMAAVMHHPQRAEQVAHTRRRLLRAAWWAEATANDQTTFPGDVRNTIIGQGDVLLTPLQVAQIASLAATGGRMPRPRLSLDTPVAWQEIPLDARTLAQVREGMEQVVERGTASRRSVGLRGLDVAGKTGTAERAKGQPNLAWFMGYYPASQPEIAFAVLVDRTAGHGGGVCGPVARQIVQAYEASRGGKVKRR
jgi:penicillin-binding protein 2